MFPSEPGLMLQCDVGQTNALGAVHEPPLRSRTQCSVTIIGYDLMRGACRLAVRRYFRGDPLKDGIRPLPLRPLPVKQRAQHL